jgi:hypothetical protein
MRLHATDRGGLWVPTGGLPRSADERQAGPGCSRRLTSRGTRGTKETWLKAAGRFPLKYKRRACAVKDERERCVMRGGGRQCGGKHREAGKEEGLRTVHYTDGQGKGYRSLSEHPGDFREGTNTNAVQSAAGTVTGF